MKKTILMGALLSFIVVNPAFGCDAHANAEKAKKDQAKAVSEVKKDQVVAASREVQSLPAPAATEKTAK